MRRSLRTHCRFTANKDVRQVNTSEQTSHQSPSQFSTGGEHPVLARVPWLAEPATGGPTPEAADPTGVRVDPSLFEPHSVLATPDLGVTTWENQQDPKLRFDPPQPLATNAADKPAAPQPQGQPAPPEPTRATTSVREQVATPQRPVTHLRFDAPETTVHEPVPAKRVQTPPAISPWHHWVATIDDLIRHNHRVIMVLALIALAGLMVLLLGSQTPTGGPAVDAITPAAQNDAPQNIDPPKDVVVSVPTFEKLDEPLVVARGPQSNERLRSTTVEPSESILLEPLPAMPTLGPANDITPIGDATASDAEGSDTAADTSADKAKPTVVGYPTTNQPSLNWPTSPSPPSTPSTARLSRELRSVH